MSLLTRTLYAPIAKIAQAFRATRQVFSRVFQTSGIEVYPDINVRTAIDKGFNANTAAYSIIMEDAVKFGSIPRYVYDKKVYEEKATPVPIGANAILWEQKAYKPYNDKPVNAFIPTLTQLLNRPNEYISQDLFFESIRCYHKSAGEAFIWLNRGDLEKYRNADGSFRDEEINRLPVLEMYVLPSDRMILLPDPGNLWGILAWILDVNERIHIRKDDVIHWKTTNLNFNPDTREHQRGLSPFKPGKKSLETNNSMTDAMVRGAQNDGAKYVLFNETMDKMTPTQQTDLKAVIDKKINNNDVKGAVATLQGKWGGLDLGRSSVDLQLLEGREFSWKELCFLLKVPYEFFDSHTPFAEKQLTQIGWITNRLQPATSQLDGELNRVLLKAFNLEGKAFIACDYTGLPEMKKLAVESAKSLKETGVVSPNEIREYLGYERVDNPILDEIWMQSGMLPVSMIVDDNEGDEALIAQMEGIYGKPGKQE